MNDLSTPLSAWRPARRFPLTYPGDRPSRAYVLLDDRVHLISFGQPEDLGSAIVHLDGGSSRSLDEVLTESGLPTLGQRFPVIAYGANRNPATLSIKFQNYGYDSNGAGIAVPVLKGTLLGADMVAGGVSGQGYFYGDLLLESPWTRATRMEAWLTLVDRDQLRAINDSEGVRMGGGSYALAYFPHYRIDGWARDIAPLGYAGKSEIFVSPQLGTPMAFSAVEAEGRDIYAGEPLEMIDHVLNVYDLRAKLAAIAHIPNDASLSRKLSAFMNLHWWHTFERKEESAPGFARTLAVLRDVFHGDACPMSTARLLGERGRLLTTETAYDPGEDLTLAGVSQAI